MLSISRGAARKKLSGQTSKKFRRAVAAVAFTASLIGAFSFAHGEEATRPFTDSAGRVIQVPVEVKGAFSVGFPGTLVLYTLCREKLVAWNTAPTGEQQRFIQQECLGLPALGGWGGSNAQASLEQLIALKPDVIISVGEISAYWISNADRVEKQTGIPVALIACDLTEIDKTYRLAGELLGVEERADKLAGYCRDTLNQVEQAVAGIPREKRVRVYYAEGPRGLQTDSVNSFHTQVLDFAGGLNVAKGVTKGGAGRTNVSMENVVAWAPECILLDAETAEIAKAPMGTVFRDPVWQAVPAVSRGAVYVIPRQPFNWFGRPPSVNRILGVKWVAHTLYPEAYPIDMTAAIQEYYALFYDISLSAEEARRLERGEVLP